MAVDWKTSSSSRARELRNAWKAGQLRASLRSSGGWSILWGIVAIVTGATTLKQADCNAVLLLIGLFLLGAGIAAWRAPSPTTLRLDAASLLTVGLWNIVITILNITAGNTSQGFWGFLGLMQIVWAVQRFVRAGQFNQGQAASDSLIAEAQSRVRDVRQANRATTPDLIGFQAKGKSWKARLSGEVVTLVAGAAQEVHFVPSEAFSLVAQEEVEPRRQGRCTIQAGTETWSGKASYESLQRYEQVWKASLVATSTPAVTAGGQSDTWPVQEPGPEPVASVIPAAQPIGAAELVSSPLPAYVKTAPAGQTVEPPSAGRALSVASRAAPPILVTPRWPPAVALLNLSGLGLGYLFMRRWRRWVFHLLVTIGLIVLLWSLSGSVAPPWLWVGLGVWLLWMVWDGWWQARRSAKAATEKQAKPSWVPIALAILLVGVEISALRWYMMTGQLDFDAGMLAFEEMDCPTAMAHLGRVIVRHRLTLIGQTNAARQAFYECSPLAQAAHAREVEDYGLAVGAYKAYLKQFSDGRFTDQVHQNLADAYAGWAVQLRKSGDFAGAIDNYQIILQGYADTPPAAQAEAAIAQTYAEWSQDTGEASVKLIQETWDQVCAGKPASSPVIGVLGEEPPKAWYEGDLFRLAADLKAVKPGHLRYAICVEKGADDVQRCSYIPLGTVVRQKQWWRVQVLDVLTGRTISQNKFYGADPPSCPFTQSFGASKTVYRVGENPPVVVLDLWLKDVLDSKQAAVLPPASAPTLTPVPTRSPAAPMMPKVGGTPTKGAAPTKSGTLSFWHPGPETEWSAITAILAQYEAAHPGVRVNFEFHSKWQTELPAAVAAGDAPDVVMVGNDWLSEGIQTRQIVPLDAYVDEAWVRQRFVDIAAQAAVRGGGVYGLPTSLSTLTMIYNKAFVREQELPTSADDLLVRASIWLDSDYYLVYDATNSYFSACWFYGAGAWYVNEDRQVGLNTPGGLAAARLIGKLKQAMPQDVNYGVVTDLFQQGAAGLILNGPWYLKTLEDTGIEYGLALIPPVSAGGPAGKPLVYVSLLAITPGALERGRAEAAVDLIKYYTDVEAQVRLATENRTVPTARAAVEDKRVQALPGMSHFVRQAGQGVLTPDGTAMGSVWGPVDAMLKAIWNGTSTVEEAVSQAQREIEAALK